MQKCIVTALAVFFFVMLFQAIPSRAQEDGGFRGMKWGTPIAEIRMSKELVLKQDDGARRFVYYAIANDDLRFRDVTAASIRYFFWKDKFAGVVIAITGRPAFTRLKEAMHQQFGIGMTGMGPSGEPVNVWEDETTEASLTYDQDTGKGQLVLFSKMIQELKQGLETEKVEGAEEE